MSKYSIWLGLAIALNAMSAQSAHAIGKRDVPISMLEDGQRFEVASGYGLTINLMPVGKVNRAWLTDKSWLTIANENGACPNGGCGQSRFLYLQRIDKLNFDGLPSTVDGATLLNVVTTTGEILQFHLVRDKDGIPSYTALYVQPASEPVKQVVFPRTPISKPVARFKQPIDIAEIPVEILLGKSKPVSTPKSQIRLEPVPNAHATSEPQAPTVEKAEPLIDAPTVSPQSLPVAKKPESKPLANNQAIAGAILRGLHSPQGKKEVRYWSYPYRQAQDLIYLLKVNPKLSLDQAIARSGIQPSVAQALIRYGQR